MARKQIGFDINEPIHNGTGFWLSASASDFNHADIQVRVGVLAPDDRPDVEAFEEVVNELVAKRDQLFQATDDLIVV